MSRSASTHLLTTRICHHFRSSNRQHGSARPLTFTDLPPAIRRRIYSFIYDVRPEALYSTDNCIDVTTEKHTLCDSLPEELWETWCRLRLVSRVVAADQLPWFCSTHLIALDWMDISYLAVEESPIPSLIPSFKRLFLDLNKDSTSEDSPLPESREVPFPPRTWKQFCCRLSAIPSLVLYVDCYFTTARYAAAILGPLEDLNVSKLAVQLSDTFSPEIMEVIQSSVRKVAHRQASHKGHFRFLDLPIELRQHVLRFTDLVAPTREVLWERNEFSLYHHLDAPRLPAGRCFDQEFCSQAGNAMHPPCGCFRAPRALFLVCRIMTEDARMIFYSSNRFIITPQDHELNDTLDEMTLSVDTRALLTKAIPTKFLCCLRELDLLFDYSSFVDIDTSLLSGLIKAVHLLAQNASRLTLAVHIDMTYRPGLSPVDFAPDEDRISNCANALRQLMELFTPLRQMAAFFVFVSSMPHEGPPVEKQSLRLLEQELEQFAMGDTYDALARGKLLRRKGYCDTQDLFLL